MRKSWLEAFWEAGLVLRRSAGGGMLVSHKMEIGFKLTEGVSFCRLAAATSSSTVVNEVSFLSKAFRFNPSPLVFSISSFSIFSQLSSAALSLSLLLLLSLVFDCASS